MLYWTVPAATHILVVLPRLPYLLTLLVQIGYSMPTHGLALAVYTTPGCTITLIYCILSVLASVTI